MTHPNSCAVLFVDDEPGAAGLKQMLRGERSLDDAIRGERRSPQPEHETFDALVTDLRMRGWTRQLLSTVKASSHGRIVLSGR
jgi:hypothetical protein